MGLGEESFMAMAACAPASLSTPLPSRRLSYIPSHHCTNPQILFRRSSFGIARNGSPRFLLKASSHQDSAFIENEADKVRHEIGTELNEQRDGGEAMVGSFNDQLMKAQGISTQQAEKVVTAVRDALEKARAFVAITAEEMAELGTENLRMVATVAPDPIKDVAETALNVHSQELKRLTRIHDFCLGIPYGVLLVFGGMLWFLLTGSIAAIRFGVLLGGMLLVLSTLSLDAWKKGKSRMLYTAGQAVITLTIFIREVQRFPKTSAFFPTAVVAVVSAAMLIFYMFIYFFGESISNGPKSKPSGPLA